MPTAAKVVARVKDASEVGVHAILQFCLALSSVLDVAYAQDESDDMVRVMKNMWAVSAYICDNCLPAPSNVSNSASDSNDEDFDPTDFRY
eukprot:COSAG06_NODE_56255_length_285_cov_1.526882_1_plen_89_part_01